VLWRLTYNPVINKATEHESGDYKGTPIYPYLQCIWLDIWISPDEPAGGRQDMRLFLIWNSETCPVFHVPPASFSFSPSELLVDLSKLNPVTVNDLFYWTGLTVDFVHRPKF
jgi:hypothetical protein